MPSTQDQTYARWRADPEPFWAEAAEAVHWYRRWNQVLDASRASFYRWFSGGVVNTCYNALDRHVAAGRADQPALIYDSPVTQTVACFTYRDLLDRVSRFAGVLLGQGVKRGDRVIIYMPMVPEAAVAMLACARIGAIHSVVFGGFAAPELAARISHAQPTVIVSASCGVEPNRVVSYKPLLDKAIELAAVKPRRYVPVERIVAGVDDATGEPSEVRRPRGVEDRAPSLVPMDRVGGFAPEPLRLGAPTRIHLVLGAWHQTSLHHHRAVRKPYLGCYAGGNRGMENVAMMCSAS